MARFFLRLTFFIAIASAVIAQQWLAADQPPPAQKRRSAPPKWDRRIIDSFFPDARSTLEGPRPDFAKSSTPSGAPVGNVPAGGTSDTPDPAAGGAMAWSKLISAETLQDEIKSYQTPLRDDVKNPSEFKGNRFKRARDEFSMLAVAFGVIGQYDGDVRWKDQAATARDLFAKAGVNCKVNTDQAFNDAKGRADDLAALIRGDTLPAAANAEAKPPWSKVANRPPLMHRLEQAQQNRLAPWTSNAADFGKNLDGIAHEAQVIAVLAEIIQQEGYDYTDDNSYKGYARDMQKQALEIAAAAKAKNFDQARAASGALAKACSNCHGGFRQ